MVTLLFRAQALKCKCLGFITLLDYNILTSLGSSRPGWLNNSNFVLRKASSDNPAKEVTEFFNKTNLEGKQVWYFTAPASLPITVLKDMEIDLTKAAMGDTLLSYKGDDYSVELEAHATNTQIQLLIPSQGGDNYTSRTLNRSIFRLS